MRSYGTRGRPYSGQHDTTPANAAHNEAIEYDTSRDLVQWFDSPADFADYMRDKSDYTGYGGQSWFNDNTSATLRSKLDLGCRDYVERAEALLEQLKDDGLLSEGQKIWQADVVGMFPNVPNYLMGQPETMFNKIETDLQANTTPIRIFIENCASGGVDVKQLISRGVATLGLVLALQSMRPIELYCFNIVDAQNRSTAHGTCIRIDTAPLDLDRATYMLCDPGFYRGLQYGAAHHIAGASMSSWLPWAWCSSPSASSYRGKCRHLLGLAPQDLLIPGVYLFDELYQRDPVAWIRKELAAIKEAGV